MRPAADLRPSGLGAWGVQWEGVGAAGNVLHDAPSWSRAVISVEEAASAADDDTSFVGAAEARCQLPSGGEVLMECSPLKVRLRLPAVPAPDCVVQPFLSAAAAVANYWLGGTCFHAGCFVVGDGAWGVLAPKEGGKTTTLALLARRGLRVLTDDVLAYRAGTVFAGPRCIDLREDAAAHLGIGVDLGKVGLRERWRVYLPTGEFEVPLHGWLTLGWAEQTEISSVPARERLGLLLGQRIIPLPIDPQGLLEIAALPMLTWSRPKSWESAERDLGLLVEQLSCERERWLGRAHREEVRWQVKRP